MTIFLDKDIKVKSNGKSNGKKANATSFKPNHKAAKGRIKGSKNKPKLISPAKTGKFAKGQSGNPKGRPQGSKSNFQIFAEKVGEGYVIECLHLVGKAACGRLTENDPMPSLEAAKILIAAMPRPKYREDLIKIVLPSRIETHEDLKGAHNVVIQAMAHGEISPSEAKTVAESLGPITSLIDIDLVERHERLKQYIKDKEGK